MEIIGITRRDLLWNELADYADECPWKAGKSLAELLYRNKFEDFERPFAAVENGRIIGFCTLRKKDSLSSKYLYTPFLGYVFVAEEYRGKHISEAMIKAVLEYARISGFGRVYVVSGEEGLYEKYGFRSLGIYETVYGTKERLLIINT